MKKIYYPLLAAGFLTCAAASMQAAPQGVVATAEEGEEWGDQKPYGPTLTMAFVVTDNGSQFMAEGNIVCPTQLMSDWETGAPDRDITGKIEKVYVEKSCYEAGVYNELVTEWTDLTPGQELQFADDSVLPGYNWVYTAYAVVNGLTSDNWYGQFNLYSGFRPESPESVKGTSVQGHAPITVSMVIPDAVQGTLSDGLVYAPERVYVTRSFRPEGEWMSTDPEEVWSQENPEKGVEISFVDTNNGEELAPGTYTYDCYVSWKWGESYPTSVNVGLFEDAPGDPQDVFARAVQEGVVITWTPPVEGDAGGWVNPEGITYDVYRYSNFSRGALVASDVEGLSALDDLEGIDAQTLMQYQVIAKNHLGSSSDWGGISSEIIVGPGKQLPFVETFPSTGFSADAENIWIRQLYAGDANWYTAAYAGFADETGKWVDINPSMEGHGMVQTGFASYYPYGVSCYMSGDIDFTEFENGTLTFSYYTHPLGSVDLAVDIVRYDDFDPDQSDIMPLDEGDAYEMVWFGSCQGEEGWQDVSVDFTGFKDSDSVMIRFRAMQDIPDSGVYVPCCIQYVKLEGKNGDVHVEGLGAEAASVEYYNLQGVRIAAPVKGEVSIRRTILSDGSVRASKVVVK